MLLGDQPHDGHPDPLDFDEVVEHLASLVLSSRASTPFTLGIEAPWGMGKSTLMGQLKARLDDEKSVRPVLFNAWTADDGGVLEGLVKTVLNELDEKVLRRALRDEKLMRVVRVVTGVLGGLIGVGSVVDTVWNRVVDDPRARNELRDLVNEAVAAWRNERPEIAADRMLCVFVDDLDRCSPEGVLEVFEAMKLYLDVPGIVFVVGYDQDIVSELVLKKKGYSEQIAGRDYLEKFIQIVYRIPRSVSDQSDALLKSLLETSGTASLFGATERKLVIEGSASNPRRIKRFINGFVLAYGLDGRWRDFDPQSLIRLHLLHMYFPEFARMLERSSKRDPIEEYLEYRQARDLLRRRDPSSEANSKIVKVLGNYGLLAVGPDEVMAEAEALLSRLEDQVPIDFTQLVDRDDFTSLVQSLAATEDWPKLRSALAEGTLSQVVAPDQRNESHSRGIDISTRFEGLSVLWADDEGEADNNLLIAALELGGAEVKVVRDEAATERSLTSRSVDVLISDIARGKEPEAGLEAVERLRARVTMPPTIVFYTSRVTQARVRRAAGLGAVLTTDSDELLDLVADRARRSGAGGSRPGGGSGSDF
jgi:hypothetical protein